MCSVTTAWKLDILNSHRLLKCFIKIENFKDALLMARQLLNKLRQAEGKPFGIAVVMSCLKAILRSDAGAVKDIKINDYVNMIIIEV